MLKRGQTLQFVHAVSAWDRSKYGLMVMRTKGMCCLLRRTQVSRASPRGEASEMVNLWSRCHVDEGASDLTYLTTDVWLKKSFVAVEPAIAGATSVSNWVAINAPSPNADPLA